MSTPPKPVASLSLAPPFLPVLVPQLPITPVRHDKDKENCFSPSALLLPCFRLVTADGLQVTLEPMDRRQAQLQYIDYKLNALQGKQREGRKRRNTNPTTTDDKQLEPHDTAAAAHHAVIARDRENRPQQPRLTSPYKPRFVISPPPSMPSSSSSAPSTVQSGSGGTVGQSMVGSIRTPSRKPLLPRFPPNPSMVAKANSSSSTPGRQRRAQ